MSEPSQNGLCPLSRFGNRIRYRNERAAVLAVNDASFCGQNTIMNGTQHMTLRLRSQMSGIDGSEFGFPGDANYR